MTENEIGKIVVDRALKLHMAMGPGLLETVYEVLLAHELKKQGLKAIKQVAIPIVYDNIKFDQGFQADIIVENKVLLELKSVEKIHNVHKKQVLTYLKLTGIKLGFLLNFGEETMKKGITRIINGYFD